MHKQGGTKRAEGEMDWQKIKTTSTQASRPLLGLICHCLPNWVTGQEYQPCTAVCWLGKLLSFLGGVLVPVFLQTGARRNRYLRLLSGHVKQSKPCLQGLGGAPRAYYLVLTFLCLSQRDSHQQVFPPHYACFMFTLTAHFHPLSLSSCWFWFCRYVNYCVAINKLWITPFVPRCTLKKNERNPKCKVLPKHSF